MSPILIAHRGEPESWPENSLIGFRSVLEAGARLLETDVQLTSDGVPVLSHDPTLLKVTGHDLLVTQTSYADLKDLPAGQPGQFGTRFSDQRIVHLDEFATLLGHWPDARAFVEFKPDSLQAFGIETVVDTVLKSRAQATALAPQYLFVNRKRLPDDAALWDGPWQWVVYTLNTAQEITAYLERGARMVETNVICELLNEPSLRAQSRD